MESPYEDTLNYKDNNRIDGLTVDTSAMDGKCDTSI